MAQWDRVQTALRQLGVNVRVVELDTSTATAQQAALAVACELGAIVKSLLFLIDGHPNLVLVAGDRMADQRKLAAHFGLGKRKVRLADSETVRRVTGYEVGGVPPVGHDVHLPVLLDESLARFDIVWAAAGASNAVFAIPYSILKQITGGQAVDLA